MSWATVRATRPTATETRPNRYGTHERLHALPQPTANHRASLHTRSPPNRGRPSDPRGQSRTCALHLARGHAAARLVLSSAPVYSPHLGLILRVPIVSSARRRFPFFLRSAPSAWVGGRPPTPTISDGPPARGEPRRLGAAILAGGGIIHRPSNASASSPRATSPRAWIWSVFAVNSVALVIACRASCLAAHVA